MIIFRYLTKEIIRTLLAATVILSIIFVTNQSVQFLQRAASGQLPATQVLHLIVLQIPLVVGYLLPLGLYLGILLTLGRMYVDSEMTVLFACGMSRAKLTRMILVIAFFVACVVMWLMATVVPNAQGDVNAVLDKAAVSASVHQIIPARFMVFGRKNENPVVFYAKQVEDHKVLRDVFMAQKAKQAKPTDPEKWDVIVAKTAREKKISGQGGHYLLFQHGYRYSGVPGENSYHMMHFKEYGIHMFVSQIPKPNAAQYYSFSKLWSLRNKDIQSAAELQWRLAMPISVFMFALLAIPLSEVRPRYGKFTQLIPAMLIYITYADLIFLCRSWISGGRLSPELGMWWVHALGFLLAAFLFLNSRLK